jgi:hypothetical protein
MSELTVGTLSGLPANDNVISLASGSQIVQPGMVLAVNAIRNSTRQTAPTGTAARVLFSGNFTKILDSSLLIAQCTVFGNGHASGQAGVGMVLDNTLWDHGCAYQYDGAWSGSEQTTIVVGNAVWSGIPKGLRNVGFGYRPANGSINERPFITFNPNSSDGARIQQMTSSIIIYEIAQ